MSFDFNEKPAAASKAVPSGQTFLAQSKEEHSALFADFADRSNDYSSLAEFMAAVQIAAWELSEQLAKTSFGNGIARGRARHSK